MDQITGSNQGNEGFKTMDDITMGIDHYITVELLLQYRRANLPGTASMVVSFMRTVHSMCHLLMKGIAPC